uniref:Glyco_hydro_31 n=1 Tax=Anisakis simplex TaxID=6269 RepID=A0A0M3JDJ7_ANISI
LNFSSTFPSSGHYAGHWLGDNSADFADLRSSVINIQAFNMFGIPFVGADICGFYHPATLNLCARWHQLGAFYSLSRVHKQQLANPQYNEYWMNVADAMRIASSFRYRYLPYLYTLHFEASRSGGTVVRPLFFEFPNDDAAHEVDRQFMWGHAFLVAPILKVVTLKPNMDQNLKYPNVRFANEFLNLI